MTMEELLREGVAASSGFAIGQVFRFKPAVIETTQEVLSQDEAPLVASRFSEILRQSLHDLMSLHDQVVSSGKTQQADILGSHISILEDPLLEQKAIEKILSGKNSGWAVRETFAEFAKAFEKINSAYIKERVVDLHEVGDLLLRAVMNVRVPSFAEMGASSIVVAPSLSASDVAKLDFSKVVGLVLESGSTTSHTAIIARSHGVPAVVGLKGVSDEVRSGDSIAIDGDNGTVWIAPSHQRVDSLRTKMEQERIWNCRWKSELHEPCATLDGHRIAVGANVGGDEEIARAVENGADEVGLFRTEFLFLERRDLPDVEEQFAIYRNVAQGMRGRPVIVRTLDVGGDKMIPGIAHEDEENPFLGVRGIRLCLENIELFSAQLSAILRASAHGSLKIMIPMVDTVEEVIRTRTIIQDICGTLATQGISFDANIPVGIMIETPIAAFQIKTFAPHVDFFSIGSNDLLQYMMAVDRGNPKLAPLYDSCHPAFLTLIANLIGQAREVDKPIGICGELAGDPLFTVFLLGAGLKKFSMNIAAIPRTKYLIRHVSLNEAEETTMQVLALRSSDEVRQLLQRRNREIIERVEKESHLHN